jgi:hypothetical protein
VEELHQLQQAELELMLEHMQRPLIVPPAPTILPLQDYQQETLSSPRFLQQLP